MMFDVYHVQISEGDLLRRLKRHFPLIGHIQIAGVPDRHEPDAGEVNYAYVFKLLDELRYDGWVGCEYRPATSTTAGLTWLYRLLDRKPAATQRAPG
jgi:hydroxypyruvate isomerase